MTDRDALIERAVSVAEFLENLDIDGLRYTHMGKTLRDLISLTSPSWGVKGKDMVHARVSSASAVDAQDAPPWVRYSGDDILHMQESVAMSLVPHHYATDGAYNTAIDARMAVYMLSGLSPASLRVEAQAIYDQHRRIMERRAASEDWRAPWWKFW